MSLKNIENHTATQCSALAKHTQRRCLNLAAYNTKVCRFHGANRKPIAGEAHHWYIDGSNTRQLRKEKSAKLKMLKQCDALLLSGKPILELPFDTPEARLINKYMAKEIKRAKQRAIKVVTKAHKKSKPVKKMSKIL
ncbi:MAG: hypothetical protein ACXW1W_01295 [Methylococcaceae bacterium]